jgi:hypothetical protein
MRKTFFFVVVIDDDGGRFADIGLCLLASLPFSFDSGLFTFV